MGFELKRKIYRLDFAGTGLDGLEIDMYGMSTKELMDLEELQEEGERSPEAGRKAMDFFTSKIKNWNRTEDDLPVPVTTDRLLELEPGDLMLAMEKYKEKISGVPGPLDSGSTSGSRWEGEPIPMAVPSIPLPNLSTPG